MKKQSQAQARGIENKRFYFLFLLLSTLTFFIFHPNLFGSIGTSYPASTAPTSISSTMEHFQCEALPNDAQNPSGTNRLKCKLGNINKPLSQVTPSITTVPAPFPTVPTSMVLFDDNTNTQYQGWTVQRKESVNMGPPYNLNGMIIGRLDPKEEASRTYILQSDMKQYFRLTFLFLKIGSPDNERAEFSINNIPIIGQNFWLYRDDPIVVGGQTVSVPFEPYSNKPLVFNPQWNAQSYPGQVMAVTMVFKKNGNNMALVDRNGNPTSVSFPLNGNQLLLKLKSGLDEPIANESFAIMNLKGETFDTLDPQQIIPTLPTGTSPSTVTAAAVSSQMVLFDDNMSNGYPGWIVPRKELINVPAPYNLNGPILGRLSLNDIATKTFTLPTDMKRYFQLTISPLMKIDSPDAADNDSITLRINGFNIFSQVMDFQKSTPVVINGEEKSVDAEPYTAKKNLVFSPNWADEFLYVNLVFEKVGNDMVLLNRNGTQTNVKFPLNGNQFTIQLIAHLNQDINDESFGAANIKGITFDTLDPTRLIPKFPPQ